MTKHLIIMRHAEAASAAIGEPDRARQLTAHGMKQAAMTGKQLHSRISRIDLALVSPYVRAQQTFRQVQKGYQSEIPLQICDDITPDCCVDEVYAQINALEGDTVLMVSHLPLVADVLRSLAFESVPFTPATAVCCSAQSWLEDAWQIEWLVSG